jgi:hypothetical protein
MSTSFLSYITKRGKITNDPYGTIEVICRSFVHIAKELVSPQQE